MSPTPTYRLLLLLITNFALLISTTKEVSALGWGGVQPTPSESECRPYIEKALKEQLGETPQEAAETTSTEDVPTETPTEIASEEGSIDNTEETPVKTENIEVTPSEEKGDGGEEVQSAEGGEQSGEMQADEPKSEGESTEEETVHEEEESTEDAGGEQLSAETETAAEESAEVTEIIEEAEVSEQKSTETIEEVESAEQPTESTEETEVLAESKETDSGEVETEEAKEKSAEEKDEVTESAETAESKEQEPSAEEETPASAETVEESVEQAEESVEQTEESVEHTEEESTEQAEESAETVQESAETQTEESIETEAETQPEESTETQAEESAETEATEESAEQATEEVKSAEQDEVKSAEEIEESKEEKTETAEQSQENDESVEEESKEGEQVASELTESAESKEIEPETVSGEEDTSKPIAVTEAEAESSEGGEEDVTSTEETPEEDLTLDVIIPEKLRSRDHLAEILRLGPEAAETEQLLSKTIDITLRELKRLYDNAIKPLEMLYKYRDLSNRHFGDPEIFSKPLVLFMGPWSGGKSTIINYLLDNEYKKTALRTGAEPSPAYFNIVMWGEDEEILDGTQLAADWTFSGLQKFGQGLLDRLRGLRLNKPLLEKVNIVEIPGILEIRKQVERLFPFNDACQWFIDRADIIFLVYDPSKLDVGPETEAILDQLKGREYQTRIILNKADQVKPEELMRVQGTLIWNISPLMSSPEPPVMYSTSLWSLPYEVGAPARLLYAQERAFLRDLREAVDKRVENKIASARRFAVRVRNHAKMVDCYLTTFYNHKSFFGNKKKVADDIIEHPQNYHIYEGLSTLTNISRYDLPDPEVYRDFFRLNAVYEFQQLSSTCTYFRGCPINRLDIAIAYDLPELVGKYKKSAEQVLTNAAAQKPKS
ncbi:uncharacterized protein LOC142332364 [Lycorma delicatula]|uniref:uncharacterized protein LOC142332364 n=1 Tax=Lycorma delicatula TaxID=130591 RepID=UPI003F50EC46